MNDSIQPLTPNDVQGYLSKWMKIRYLLTSKMIQCPDCRYLRDTFVATVDMLMNVEEETRAKIPAGSETIEVANATVHHVNPPTPPTPGSTQGEEVAPGVVMVRK